MRKFSTNINSTTDFCILCTTFRSKFFVSQCRKNWKVNPSVLRFRKFPVAKKFMDKKGGESFKIFRRSFCLTVPKHFIGKHFGVVSEKFLYRKFSCIGGAGASRFCRNFLSHSTETKSFVKKPFCFPEIFWYRKKIMDKRGHITIFSRNFYVSHCRKLS